jgi:hypothetical protein
MYNVYYLDGDKFSNMNESTLSKFDQEIYLNYQKSGKSNSKANLYANDNSLNLNYNYEKRNNHKFVDELGLLQCENKELKLLIENYKVSD